MKEIVVYYSMSGCTRKVAELIAQKTGADIKEIELVKPLTTRSAFTKGVMPSRKGEALEITEQIDVSDYDRVWLGTPVWAFTAAAPINAVLKSNDFSGKEVVIFATHGNTHGNTHGKTFDNIKERIQGAKVVDVKSFKGKDVLKDGAPVQEWLETLLKKCQSV